MEIDSESPKARELVKKLLEQIPADKRQFLILDVGTTGIKAKIYDTNLNVVVSKYQRTQVIRIGDDGSEIDPEELWKSVIQICKECISETEETGKYIVSMGLTTLRESFVIWNKSTLKPICNIITWQDRRAVKYIENLNESVLFTMYKKACGLKCRFRSDDANKLFNSYVFTENNTGGRLGWLISTNSDVKKAFDSGSAHFGTVESWLIQNLTKGKMHISDISSASTTGMFDPINCKWHEKITPFIGADISAFPKVTDTHGMLAVADGDIFGMPIPITAIIGDQQASLYGCGCVLPGNIKATFGTGIFINAFTGCKIVPCMSNGCYPVVAWKHLHNINYSYESRWDFASNELQRLLDSGKIKDETEINKLIDDHFQGNQLESEDDTSFKSKSIVEAIEILALRFHTVWKKFRTEFSTEIIDFLRIDGGISRIKYLLRCISSLTMMPILVSNDPDGTCLGACILCQIGAGIQDSRDNIKRICLQMEKYEPDPDLRSVLEKKLDHSLTKVTSL